MGESSFLSRKAPTQFHGMDSQTQTDEMVTDVTAPPCSAQTAKDVTAPPCSAQTAALAVRALLHEWIFRYGVPLRIPSDQGRVFSAAVVQHLCESYGIRQSRTTPYNPQGNGQCERFNRSLIAFLSALTPQQKRHWDKHLNNVLFCCNII